MPAERPTLFLSAAARKRRARLHPWVFSNEIENPPMLEPGGLVTLREKNRPELWTAYYNPHSLIAARILARGEVEIDGAWASGRIRRALELRRRLGLARDALRLVHSEADGLPGLIVDRYADVLVLESLTAGMDRLLPLVVEALRSELAPRAIVGRLDSEMRALEGLAPSTTALWGELPGRVRVSCHGTPFDVDVVGGQKTGLFLDQMENIEALARFAPGARVLDVCCYAGACAIRLARAGAEYVQALDVSVAALACARANAELAGVSDRIHWQEADAFRALPELVRAGERFDVVHVDPPAFAKRKRDLPAALSGYRELNRRAFRLMRPGGILATSTCSHHVTAEMFLEMLSLAARDGGRHASILEVRGQAADHPPLLSAPETRYLTCVLLCVE
ncbi:class I SAM-dependent rRNA methyltransferase [bacterium]|nr:class I SAM-dependent rRNA methyltransferase [bacterium]